MTTGTASLTGATVLATYQAGAYVAKTYTILSSTGLGGTTFAGLTNVSLPSGFNASLSCTATEAILNLVLSNPVSPISSLPPNQQGPGNAIANYFNNGGTLPPGFVTLVGLTASSQQNAYAQVSGEGSASGPTQTSYASISSFMSTMLDPWIDGRGQSSGMTSFADGMSYAPARKVFHEVREAYAAVTPRDARSSFDPRWSLWASGYGGADKVSGDSSVGSNSTSSRIYGTAVGADYRVSRDARFGFALGGAGMSFSTLGLGSGRSDAFQAGVYGRHGFAGAYLSGALAYGWQDVTTTRTVTVAGSDTLEGRFKTNTFSGRGEIGYRYASPFGGIAPYGALQYLSIHLPGYSENAIIGSNQFALSFASKTGNNLRSELGFRTDKSFLVADGSITLRGRAAWVHDSNTSRAVSQPSKLCPARLLSLLMAHSPPPTQHCLPQAQK